MARSQLRREQEEEEIDREEAAPQAVEEEREVKEEATTELDTMGTRKQHYWGALVFYEALEVCLNVKNNELSGETKKHRKER